MKNIYFTFLIVLLFHLVSIGQSIYKATFDLNKKPVEFFLINSSEKDSLKVTVVNKHVQLLSPNEYFISKTKKKYEIVKNNNDTIKILIHKRILEFPNGYSVHILKRNSRKIVLADNGSNIVLNALSKEKKGKIELLISVNSQDNLFELLSIATYHLYTQAKLTKEASESSFMLFFLIGVF